MNFKTENFVHLKNILEVMENTKYPIKYFYKTSKHSTHKYLKNTN